MPTARWRAWVNARLADDYAALWRRLDALVVLAAPDFGGRRTLARRAGTRRCVCAAQPHALSPAQLRRFVMHYERISRHALRVLPALADIVVTIDANRRVRGIRMKTRRRVVLRRRNER